jgi:hypothetical protein
MIAAFAAIGSTISALTFIGLNINKKKFCVIDEKSNTKFRLAESDGTCKKDDVVYDLVFMSPLSSVGSQSYDLYSNINDQYTTNGTVINLSDTVNVFSNLEQTRYVTQVPSSSATLIDNVRTWYSTTNTTPAVINMCPQCYSFGPTATGQKAPFASAVSLPLFSSLEIGSRSASRIQLGATSGQSAFQLDQLNQPVRSLETNAIPATKFWVIPGDAVPAAPSGINPENYPINLNLPSTSGPQGLSTILYFICLVDSCVYIDLGGARGGKFPLFSTNTDSQGNPYDISKFTGGNPGTIFGTLQVKKNDVLKVYLGSPGDANINSIPALGGYGQGGQGTFLGGAYGGGASYITHFKFSVFGYNPLPGGSKSPQPYSAVLQAALSPVSSPLPILVCIAGGGGGSSRNASGGSAGFANESLTYGNSNVSKDQKPVSRFGSSGGLTNVEGDAPVLVSRSNNVLSGGGGVQTTGGQSAVTKQSKSCNGQRLIPFVPGGGGGSVYTDVGSGGGGGGGGEFGGGAGAFNDISKPNNLHGAGGGGSSWNGTLEPVSGNNVTLNYYRNNNSNSGQTSNPSSTFFRNGQIGPAGSFLNDYGYIVFGTLYSR